MDFVAQLRSICGSRFREHELLRLHTNYRLGGPARYYVEARTADEVARMLTAARDAGVRWCILGGGSNTLVADAGFDGLVVQMANREVRAEGSRVTAGAGAITSAVAMAAAQADLTGFEWAVSLPGTIGGAVRGNAGCFGGEMQDVVESVTVLDGGDPDHGTRTLARAQCGFRYRHSVFKEEPMLLVVEVTLALQLVGGGAATAAMEQFLAQRKQKQPLERPSAGCMFKNVEVERLTQAQVSRIAELGGEGWRAIVHDGQLPAGWVIDRLGMKGFRVGDAMVSEKHGNFLVNLGGATANDIAAVADAVRQRAQEVLGIALEEEVQRIGFS